jgi:hypothetical protein
MLTCRLVLSAGCTLRVSSEILAYESYLVACLERAAVVSYLRVTAVTVLAASFLLTFKQSPAHVLDNR